MDPLPSSPTLLRSAHPNDLDRKRIERALQKRKRYRYVSPTVVAVSGGYHISSPCCSRNIDPDGGIIDVALVLHDPLTSGWHLFRKDHDTGAWTLHSVHDRLPTLLDLLNSDPERTFWQ